MVDRFPAEPNNFSLLQTVRTSRGATEFRIRFVSGSFYPWDKETGSEADPSSVSNVEVKKERTYAFIHSHTVMSCIGKYLPYL